MKNILILAQFESQIGMINKQFEKPDTSTSLFFINSAIDRFIKTRYSGSNPRGLGFEQTQKRFDDLRFLLKVKVYPNTELNLDPSPQNVNKYTAQLPDDYWFALGLSVDIFSDKWTKTSDDPCQGGTEMCNPTTWGGTYIRKTVDVLLASILSFDWIVNNTLTLFHFFNGMARPIRLRFNNTTLLYTDKNYSIFSYKLIYLKRPERYTLGPDGAAWDALSTILPDHVWPLVIRIAAQQFAAVNNPQLYQIASDVVNTQL